MNTQEDEFLLELRATFKVEAAEHLQAIATGLLALEKAPAIATQRDLVATVFRAAHSLKGAARAVDMTAIESLCQTLEDQFAAWKRPENAPTSDVFDTTHRTLDAIAGLLSVSEVAARPPASAAHETVAGIADPGPAPTRSTPPAVGQRACSLSETSTAGAAPPGMGAEQRLFSAADTVRITVAKLDARLVEAEEFLTAKLTTRQRAEDLRGLAGSFETWRKEWLAVAPGAHALRQGLDRPAALDLATLLDYFDRHLDLLRSLQGRVVTLTQAAEQDHLVVGKLVDDLLASSKQLLLLPFATLTVFLAKLVRDLCRDLGKEAELVVHGEEVEIDKRILEEMKDPLIHLLRNCVDHGIEAPAQRVRRGKPACGRIVLTLSRVNDSKVEILVVDDGAGIDLGAIKESAIHHHLLSTDDARRMADSAAQALIFQDEVSSRPMITRVSGRGLGLTIVRERAEKLGGTVAVESQPGQGARFRLLLPSLLATFRGVLIEAAGRVFVVPTAHVASVLHVRAGEIQTVAGRETIPWRGRAVALARLADVLALPGVATTVAPSAITPVMILSLGDERVAFVVDAVLDEQEVLVKPLRRPLARVRNIAGATVLGSGQLVPVLNVTDLLKSARKSDPATWMVSTPKPPPPGARSLLVVEDSITSRMLLKGILESAGYQVKTAVDGLEAFTRLRAEPFDLVVSDVEMPRLNGFDLTARIRAHQKLAGLPVVLVSARESREDREHGIDVGANAYLIKSNFDQSNLLDAVRRLI